MADSTSVMTDGELASIRSILSAQKEQSGPRWSQLWAQAGPILQQIRAVIESKTNGKSNEIRDLVWTLPQPLRRMNEFLYAVNDQLLASNFADDARLRKLLDQAASTTSYEEFGGTLRESLSALRGTGAGMTALSTWLGFVRPEFFMPAFEDTMKVLKTKLGFARFVGDQSDPDAYLRMMGGLKKVNDELGISNMYESGYYLMTYPEVSPFPSWWVELTHSTTHEDPAAAVTGNSTKFGDSLGSPLRAEGGSDRYRRMRDVNEGNRILHFDLDNGTIAGVSIVENDTKELMTSEGKRYYTKLRGFTPLAPPIDWEEFKEAEQGQLTTLLNQGKRSFYASDLRPVQGYLAPAPREVIDAINNYYRGIAHADLPHYGPSAAREPTGPFRWTQKDFDSCTGAEDDANYLKRRFDELETILKPLIAEQIPTLQYSHVPRARRYPPSKEKPFQDGMWLGLSSAEYVRGEVGPQFQVFVNQWAPSFVGIWVDGRSSSEAKQKAIEAVQANREVFATGLRGKGLKVLTLADGEKNPVELDPESASSDGIVDALEGLSQRRHFAVGVRMNPTEAIGLGDNTIPRIVETIKQLIPTYEMLAAETVGKVELDPIEKLAIAHLIAGKNVIIYGPPGTGKTRLATRICTSVCGSDGFAIETGNSEWGYADVVLGYEPSSGAVTPAPGFLTKAVMNSTKRDGPYWLIIDEINRANLDLAFGRVFTLLDLDYREREPLLDASKYGKITGSNNEVLKIPASFRIVATMNTYDRSLLFALGYAFMRRFAFVEQPSLIPGIESAVAPPAGGDQASINSAFAWVSNEGNSLLSNVVFKKIEEHFKIPGAAILDKDVDDANEAVTHLKGIEWEVPTLGKFNPFQVLLALAKLLTDLHIAEVGQALVIDASKFLVADCVAFEKNPDQLTVRKMLDEAALSYLLPQIEFFMPRLKKEKVLGGNESKHTEAWDTLKLFASTLGLEKTLKRLSTAEESSRLL